MITYTNQHNLLWTAKSKELSERFYYLTKFISTYEAIYTDIPMPELHYQCDQPDSVCSPVVATNLPCKMSKDSGVLPTEEIIR